MKYYYTAKIVWGIPDNQNEQEVKITLHRVTLRAIKRLRASNTPYILIKHIGVYSSVPEYYYANLTPLGKNVINFDDCHLCADCKRLSALPDSQGGCAKARARGNSKKLEKFSFINSPLENNDVFLVLHCRNYQKVDEKEKTSKKPITDEDKIRLARLLWEHVDSIADIKDMMKKEAHMKW